MRFRAVTDADPSALICILQYLRRANIAIKSVWSQPCPGGGLIEIKIELGGLSDHAFQRLVSEVNDMPMVIAAVAFDVNWSHTGTCG